MHSDLQNLRLIAVTVSLSLFSLFEGQVLIGTCVEWVAGIAMRHRCDLKSCFMSCLRLFFNVTQHYLHLYFHHCARLLLCDSPFFIPQLFLLCFLSLCLIECASSTNTPNSLALKFIYARGHSAPRTNRQWEKRYHQTLI